MIDPKLLKNVAGWACVGAALTVVGLVLIASDEGLGKPLAVIGALLLAFCAASLAYEFFRSDD